MLSSMQARSEVVKSIVIERWLSSQTRMEDLRDGQELVGTVFRQMLYHGAQIDIGCEFDGCATPIHRSKSHHQCCGACGGCRTPNCLQATHNMSA